MSVFWKPGTVAPGSNIDRDTEKESEETLLNVFRDYSTRLSIQKQQERLPIYQHRHEILYLLDHYKVLILVGHTGSGKTTQLPQYLHQSGWTENSKIIACTQPRRVAATTVAQRVAEELSEELGNTVGYSIRFEERTSSSTRIKYMTDGMLFRESMLDPLLSKYSVIIIDEAHERSLYTDLLLGLLKKILVKRPELRVVISSATLNAEDFQSYFEQLTCYTLSIQGKMFPLDIYYLEEPIERNAMHDAVVQCVHEIHEKEAPGDILVFMTGKEEIDQTINSLKSMESKLYNKAGVKLFCLPIYAGLSVESQMKVFDPTPRGYRKVIVATNIAEASITIENIVYVVDTGMVKIRVFDPDTEQDALLVTNISKAAAQQRAGRAGRLKTGKVYRLYTAHQYEDFRPNNIPDIQRTNLATVILQLKALGIDNILKFDFLSPPAPQMLTCALELLYSLSALNDYGKLTDPIGFQLAEFPVEPMLAAMILKSPQFYCSEDVASIAAMLTVQNVFVTPTSYKDKRKALEMKKKFAVEEGDHLTLLNVYRAFTREPRTSKWSHSHFLNHKALQRAVIVRKYLMKYMKRFKLEMNTCEVDTIMIRKAITAGYFANAAQAQADGSYKSIKHGTTLYIHPNSVLFKRAPPLVVYHEVLKSTKSFMCEVSEVQAEWLSELAPHYYDYTREKLPEH